MIRKEKVYRDFRRKRWGSLMECGDSTCVGDECYREVEDDELMPEQDEELMECGDFEDCEGDDCEEEEIFEDDDLVYDDEDDDTEAPALLLDCGEQDDEEECEGEECELNESRRHFRNRRRIVEEFAYPSPVSDYEDDYMASVTTDDEEVQNIVDVASDALSAAQSVGINSTVDELLTPVEEVQPQVKTVDLTYISSLANEVVEKVNSITASASQIKMVTDACESDGTCVFGSDMGKTYSFDSYNNRFFESHTIVKNLLEVIGSLDSIKSEIDYALSSQAKVDAPVANNVNAPKAAAPAKTPIYNDYEMNGVPATSVDDEAAIAIACEPLSTIEFPEYDY